MSEHVLILLGAGSEDNYLDIVPAELVHHVSDEVEALLVGKSGDNADHHLLFIDGKSELFLECFLVLGFLLTEIGCVVFLYEIFIRLGIELLIVDAVYDSAEGIAACPEESVKSLAVELGLDLLGIGIGYGRDRMTDSP